MNWLRNNPALATGIALPLLLVIFFLLAGWLPQFFVDPPKYGVLFATNYYDSNNGVKLEVVDGKLSARFVGMRTSYFNKPRLYRYDPAKAELKEITFDILDSIPKQPDNVTPTEEQAKLITALSIPEAEALKLYTPETAPDGYVFVSGGYYRGGSPFLGEIFYSSSRYDYTPSLHKRGRIVKIRLPSDDTNSYNIKLLGWIE